MDRDASFVPPHPRFRLATLPTPLERAEGLEAALQERSATDIPRIYLKRDDLLSLGMGGNKIRNLEFSIGQALAEGATDVITLGRPQSNHCRLTAAACVKAGLRAHLVVNGSETETVTGNALLDGLFGATMHFTGTDDRAARDSLAADVRESIERAGGRPFVIPVGGADSRAALGHALNALEITRQCNAMGEELAAVVLATATGGTQAGLIAGLAKLGSDARVVAFNVTDGDVRPVVTRLAAEVARELGINDAPLGRVLVNDSQRGAGYGIPSPAGHAAIELLARSEGVLADPVYTGKALAGLIDMVLDGKFTEEECIVFLHTGGTPTLFADLGETRAQG